MTNATINATVTIPAIFAPYIMDALVVASLHDTKKMQEAEHAGYIDTVDYYKGQLTYYREAYDAVICAYNNRTA